MNETFHYKNRIKTISGTIGLILGTGFIAILFGTLIAQQVDKSGSSDFAAYFVPGLPYSAGIFVLLFAVLYLTAVDYQVTPQEVHFVRRGKVIKRFSFEHHTFSSSIAETIMVGNALGRTRERRLIVEGADGVKKFPIGLRKKEFDAFMSVIFNRQNHGNQQSEPKATHMETMIPAASYRLNQGKAFGGAFWDKFGFGLLLSPVGVIVCLVSGDGLYNGVIFGLIILAIALPVALVSALKMKSQTPKYIDVDSHNLKIDDTVFPLQDIETIKMPPHSYRTAVKMAVSLTSGKVKTYYLGYSKNSGNRVFPEHESFVEQMEEVLKERPGCFQVDL